MFNRFSRTRLRNRLQTYALMRLRSRPLTWLWFGRTARLLSMLAGSGGEGAPPYYEEGTNVGDADDVPFYDSSEVPENVRRFRSIAVARARAKRKAAGEDGNVTEPVDERPAKRTPEKKPPAAKPVREADFTLIKGIGPSFDERLKAAKVRTFGQLAALSPGDLAEILGWPEERIRRDDLIGQARRLRREYES